MSQFVFVDPSKEPHCHPAFVAVVAAFGRACWEPLLQYFAKARYNKDVYWVYVAPLWVENDGVLVATIHVDDPHTYGPLNPSHCVRNLVAVLTWEGEWREVLKEERVSWRPLPPGNVRSGREVSRIGPPIMGEGGVDVTIKGFADTWEPTVSDDPELAYQHRVYTLKGG